MFLPVLISALATQVLQSVFIPVLWSALATQVLQSEFLPVFIVKGILFLSSISWVYSFLSVISVGNAWAHNQR
jgi:hypothetical protein